MYFSVFLQNTPLSTAVWCITLLQPTSNLSHVLMEDCLPAETYRCWPESPSRIMKQLGPTFFSYMQSTISFTWPESRFLRKSLSRMASRMSCLDLKRRKTQESREKRREGKLTFHHSKRHVSRLAIQHFSNVKFDRLSMISCILLPINLSNIQFVIFFHKNSLNSYQFNLKSSKAERSNDMFYIKTFMIGDFYSENISIKLRV